MFRTRARRMRRCFLSPLAALGLALAVSGCIAYPAGPGYGYGYSPGYVAVGGGWGGGGGWGWHEGHHWRR
jgi:hypothetical protein